MACTDGFCFSDLVSHPPLSRFCVLEHVAKDLVKEHLCVEKCGDGKAGSAGCDGYDPLFLPDSDVGPRARTPRL